MIIVFQPVLQTKSETWYLNLSLEVNIKNIFHKQILQNGFYFRIMSRLALKGHGTVHILVTSVNIQVTGTSN